MCSDMLPMGQPVPEGQPTMGASQIEAGLKSGACDRHFNLLQPVSYVPFLNQVQCPTMAFACGQGALRGTRHIIHNNTCLKGDFN